MHFRSPVFLSGSTTRPSISLTSPDTTQPPTPFRCRMRDRSATQSSGICSHERSEASWVRFLSPVLFRALAVAPAAFNAAAAADVPAPARAALFFCPRLFVLLDMAGSMIACVPPAFSVSARQAWASETKKGLQASGSSSAYVDVSVSCSSRGSPFMRAKGSLPRLLHSMSRISRLRV